MLSTVLRTGSRGAPRASAALLTRCRLTARVTALLASGVAIFLTRCRLTGLPTWVLAARLTTVPTRLTTVLTWLPTRLTVLATWV
ncbi:hypothetical protein GCM10009585_06360 [Brevibacterium paucivorans]